MKRRLLALALLGCLFACSGERGEADQAHSSAAATPASVDAEAAKAEAPSQPRGRPLPAFSGYTLDDQHLEISSFIGRRLVILFFNPDVKAALPVVRAMNAIAPLRGKQNFEIVGVATGASREDAKAFALSEKLAFPVLDDSSAQLARRFGLQSPVAVLGVDSEGYLAFGMAGFGTDEVAAIEATLRRALRLPPTEAEGIRHPVAPPFRATAMDGGPPFDLSEHEGEPLVLIFFLHTCPHCHQALHALKDALAAMPPAKRPQVVGIEITGRTLSVRSRLAEEGLDFFPVYFDDDGSIQSAYSVFSGVPDMLLIDSQHRIQARMQGWDETRNEPLLRMRLAKLVGEPVPMLLRTKGYSGSEVCSVCHEMEHDTWTFTQHATAFDTLVRHGADKDPECIGCHVVGFGQPGGFTSSPETPDLEDVGCEACHGRGGPHLSPDFASKTDYSDVCVTCHDTKHSLGFDYATFRPRISHLENAKLLTLPPEEQARLLAERGRPGGSLLPTRAAYVGSDACRSCHEAEFDTWAASPHAHSLRSLEAKGKADQRDCLRCHTTGMGQPGGFPSDGRAADHADLARVGCESCHGPGADHVAAGTRAGIVSLGDKCDSCVILQICGSCHDDKNDPGFEFEVKQKIEAQRHGTTEAGTGKPLDGSSGAGTGKPLDGSSGAGTGKPLDRSSAAPASGVQRLARVSALSDAQLLARAFALSDAAEPPLAVAR